MAVIEVCPVFMTEDDFGDVALPAEMQVVYMTTWLTIVTTSISRPIDIYLNPQTRHRSW